MKDQSGSNRRVPPEAVRKIKRNSPIPYYHQLQSILREGIEQGLWNPGDLLPSEAALTLTFGVSRTAIRQALDILENEGLVYRIKGKGTLVAEPRFEFEAVRAQFPAWAARKRVQGPRLQTVVDARLGEVGGQIGQILGLRPDELVFELTAVEAIEEVPSYIVQMFVRVDASDRLWALAREGEVPTLKEGGPEVLIQLGNDYDLPTVESNVILEMATADQWEAGLLDVAANSPIIALSGVELGEDRTPVGFARILCRADQFQFSFRLVRDEG